MAFPTFGVGTFTHPPLSAGGNVSQSLYVPDGCINPHPRFATLTANIRQRRGSKVSIQVPLFQDELTPEFATTNKSRTNSADSSSVVFSMDMGDDDSSSPSDSVNTAKTTTTTSTVACELETQQPMIDMDCMAFGMGCCCLQVTFQARNLDE